MGALLTSSRSPHGAWLSSCSQPRAGSAGLEKTPKETLLLCFPKAGTAAPMQERLAGKRVAGELERGQGSGSVSSSPWGCGSRTGRTL